MTYQPDPTHQQLADMVADFAARHIAPHARAWDRQGSLPDELFAQMAPLGLLGVLIPEQFGGAGMDLASMCVICEELAKADGSTALAVSGHNVLAAGHLLRSGTDAQKQQWLAPMASGQAIGAWALTEPQVGSDAGHLQTRAAEHDGGWVLNGVKQFITNGHRADVFVVLASTDADARQRGVSAFIVPRDTDGLLIGPREDKMGMRASDTVPLTLENLELPADALLGKVNDGFIDALEVLDRNRVAFAAIAVGLAAGSLGDTLAYVQNREQFGHPLAEFQSVRFDLADMATRIDSARLLVQRAAAMQDAGKSTSAESAMAKVAAAETATFVTATAVHLHGGYGYLKDVAVERRMRDAKFMEIGQGTTEIMRMIISRHLLGRSAPETPGRPMPWR